MTDETASEHWQHDQAERCDECAAEIKRLAILSGATGLILGVAAVWGYWKMMNRD